ncbi:MAG TPA: DUF2007 domain-containing protein [Myxococcota bacterium]|nr:DUF2007 domain-containing protein [Myxococcota bacterium]HRY96064.1 DUF2007 domain-containing protein [Myxococcota bacterium]HSA24623.1 DUF2007 domain-containing protein [Myxococcota bacterium]
MADRHVLLEQSTDAMELGYLSDLLRQEGIDCFVEGVSSPQLIGVAGHVVPLRLMVLEGQLAVARELLRSIASGRPAREDEPAPGPDTPPEPGAEPAAAGAPAEAGEAPEDSVQELRDRRNVFLAGGAAFICPTGGHLYARRRRTALVLALGWLTVLAGLLLLDDHSNLLPLALACLLGVDAAGAMLAARAHNAGKRRGPGAQLALGLLLLGVAALGTLSPLALERLERWNSDRELDRYALQVTPRAVLVTNQGDFPRFVQVEATLTELGLLRAYDLTGRGTGGRDRLISGAAAVALAPGQQALFPIERPWDLTCAGPAAGDEAPGVIAGLELDPRPAPRECELRVLLISHDATAQRYLAGKVYTFPYRP